MAKPNDNSAVSPTGRLLFEIVTGIVGDRMPDVGVEDNLYSDLGFDSLDFMELVICLEQRFELVLPPHLLSPSHLSSIAEIGGIVDRLKSGTHD
ncbi:acyl carrier protein [Paenarthrobacter sp. NPDC089989]|uniref:acyl carrier protein n=1 Tax=unclassified Paenarthrobacter TaxID=2634190 RepID=UPI0038155368